MPIVIANTDGSYTITVPAPITVAPVITEVDVKESNGSEVVATPEATA